ncbi:MAG: biosynthetic-type acetolactate synthase large subunit [Herpetosiphonaceae bacterium]|nr:biosynthetic-type acetolactate synthase large subunit [Herpetosiphonaceae bacterium]
MTELTGAQIMCEALLREGVEVIFGYPGGCIMPFYDALVGYEQLHHVLVRHEQAAGHAAEGYARVTGKVGVCVATSGPGATNLVTAISDAMMDSVPIVAITGQVTSALIGRDAFQETDVTGITQPITKHNYLVTDVRELPRVFKEAFHIARTGRPGPVLIDIAKDAQQLRTTPVWPESVNLPGYKPTRDGNRKQIREAIKLIGMANKPLLMIGRGVMLSEAFPEVRELAERTGIPVITTLHGIGAFPEDHPLSLGMSGMHGWVHNNKAIQECDLLFNIGGRFDDRVTGKTSTFAPHAKIIHVDIDPSEIGKNIRVDVPIVGDAKRILTILLEELPARDSGDWLLHIREMQAVHAAKQQYTRPETPQFMPHDVFAVMTKMINERGNYHICTDVGQHQMWAAQLIDWLEPHTHITSGGAGTMGFALPAAVGAQFGDPGSTVWAVAGDGGFQMNIQELATIMQEGLPIKIAIINNGYLGMVRQWQQLFHDKRYSATPMWSPDFVKVADAYGMPGMSISRAEDVADAIATAYATSGPMLLEFRVEQEANVFPMVAPGASISDMIMSDPQPVLA